MARMSAKISSRGQMVLPAKIRKKYKLEAGTVVDLEDRDGKIIVIPNPEDKYEALLALYGCMSHIEEDVEGIWEEEKRLERLREDAE